MQHCFVAVDLSKCGELAATLVYPELLENLASHLQRWGIDSAALEQQLQLAGEATRRNELFVTLCATLPSREGCTVVMPWHSTLPRGAPLEKLERAAGEQIRSDGAVGDEARFRQLCVATTTELD